MLFLKNEHWFCNQYTQKPLVWYWYTYIFKVLSFYLHRLLMEAKTEVRMLFLTTEHCFCNHYTQKPRVSYRNAYILKFCLLTSGGHWWRPKLSSECFFLKIKISFGIRIPKNQRSLMEAKTEFRMFFLENWHYFWNKHKKNLWFGMHMSIFCLFISEF